MINSNHPITPPPELVQKLAHGPATWLEKISKAYCAGADQELEACCKAFEDIWDQEDVVTLNDVLRGIRAARRPKPPSLKAEVKEIIDCLIEGDCLNDEDALTLRRALESLPD